MIGRPLEVEVKNRREILTWALIKNCTEEYDGEGTLTEVVITLTEPLQADGSSFVRISQQSELQGYSRWKEIESREGNFYSALPRNTRLKVMSSATGADLPRMPPSTATHGTAAPVKKGPGGRPLGSKGKGTGATA